jgi:putative DNA primase/helicase
MPMTEDGTIGIAEGVETALAAWQLHGIPTWSGISDSGMAAMPLDIPGLRRLVIFADRRAAGEIAAATLRDRAPASGLEVEARLPESDDDFAKDLEQKLGIVRPPNAEATSETPTNRDSIDETSTNSDSAAVTENEGENAPEAVSKPADEGKGPEAPALPAVARPGTLPTIGGLAAGPAVPKTSKSCWR